MPIDTRCPACQTAFRLKDEFLGKKVKCPKKDCQKPFVVQPVEPAPKPKAAPAPKKSAADLEREAEELALAMFGESTAVAVDTSKPVAMVCASCDCKFEVTSDKRGKNVICPECGFRQKVPELKVEKKADWRDPNANRPSLARGEEVPDDLREQQTRQASTRSLEEAGVIKEEVEPLPLAVKLQRIALGLGVLAAIAFGVMYFLQSRSEGKEQKYMDDAVAEAEKVTDDGMTKGQAPLIKAVLMMSAAEFALRNDSPEQRKLAVDRFSAARQLAADQPASAERNAVLGELAALLPKFGGDEEQIGKEFRLRWQPAGRGAGAQLSAGPTDVQTELKRCLAALLQSGAELEFRLFVARRVARELVKGGHADTLLDILPQGFLPNEVPEAYAHIGLILHREGNPAAAKGVAEQARQLMAGNPSFSTQVLCEVAGITLKAEEKAFSVQGGGQLSYNNRMYGAVLNAVNKDANAAVAVASRDGQPDDKLRALAAVADWADSPADAVAKADAVLTGEGKGKSGARASLHRLAIAAARGGNGDAADRFVAGIEDDGLRAWAKADVVRAKAEAGKQKADTAQLEPQMEKIKIRAGNAWAAVGVARHNASSTGDQSAAKEYGGWSENTFKAGGLAGLALGLQDRKK